MRLTMMVIAVLVLLASISLSGWGIYNYLFYVSDAEVRCDQSLAEVDKDLKAATVAKGTSNEGALTKVALRKTEDAKVICAIAKSQRRSSNQTTFQLVPASLVASVVATGLLIILRKSSA